MSYNLRIGNTLTTYNNLEKLTIIENMHIILKASSENTPWCVRGSKDLRYVQNSDNLKSLSYYLHEVLELTANEIDGEKELLAFSKIENNKFNVKDYPQGEYDEVDYFEIFNNRVLKKDYKLFYHTTLNEQ